MVAGQQRPDAQRRRRSFMLRCSLAAALAGMAALTTTMA